MLRVYSFTPKQNVVQAVILSRDSIDGVVTKIASERCKVVYNDGEYIFDVEGQTLDPQVRVTEKDIDQLKYCIVRHYFGNYEICNTSIFLNSYERVDVDPIVWARLKGFEENA